MFWALVAITTSDFSILSNHWIEKVSQQAPEESTDTVSSSDTHNSPCKLVASSMSRLCLSTADRNSRKRSDSWKSQKRKTSFKELSQKTTTQPENTGLQQLPFKIMRLKKRISGMWCPVTLVLTGEITLRSITWVLKIESFRKGSDDKLGSQY